MPSCLHVLTSDAATVRQGFSFSITHGPAMRNSRLGELRFFQMAAELSTRHFSGESAESKPNKTVSRKAAKTGSQQVACAPSRLCVSLSNHRPVRNHRVLRDDDDAVADKVVLVIHVFRLAGGRDDHVVPDARIFINDGVL